MSKANEIAARVIALKIGDYYGVSADELLDGRARGGSLSHARQVAMWIAHKHFDMTVCDIARAFGFNPSSVGSGCSRLEEKLAADPALAQEVDLLVEVVNAVLLEAVDDWMRGNAAIRALVREAEHHAKETKRETERRAEAERLKITEFSRCVTLYIEARARLEVGRHTRWERAARDGVDAAFAALSSAALSTAFAVPAPRMKQRHQVEENAHA